MCLVSIFKFAQSHYLKIDHCFFFYIAGVCTYHIWTVFIFSGQGILEQLFIMRSSLVTWSMQKHLAIPLLIFGPALQVRVMITFFTVIHQNKKYQNLKGFRIGTRKCLTRPSLIEWLWTIRLDRNLPSFCFITVNLNMMMGISLLQIFYPFSSAFVSSCDSLRAYKYQ